MQSNTWPDLLPTLCGRGDLFPAQTFVQQTSILSKIYLGEVGEQRSSCEDASAAQNIQMSPYHKGPTAR